MNEYPTDEQLISTMPEGGMDLDAPDSEEELQAIHRQLTKADNREMLINVGKIIAGIGLMVFSVKLIKKHNAMVDAMTDEELDAYVKRSLTTTAISGLAKVAIMGAIGHWANKAGQR